MVTSKIDDSNQTMLFFKWEILWESSFTQNVGSFEEFKSKTGNPKMVPRQCTWRIIHPQIFSLV